MTKCAKLIDRDIISVRGEDHIEFLQNLITCNLDDVNTYGALLTPQGKIIFDFYLKCEKTRVLIDVRKELKDELVKHLGFYKLRAKVEIEDENELNVFAIWDEEKLFERKYENNLETNAELNEWHKWRISLGIPELGSDYKTKELFPHFAMMDQLENGGIDFDKGCYVGQEVVSRMQHRSNARQRFIIVQGENELPDMGCELIGEDEKKIGTMGGHINDTGLALLYMERAGKLLDRESKTINTKQGIMKCTLPDYVNFGWDTK